MERADHREWIGGRILTLLSHYWREDDPVQLTAAIGKDWADVLEGLPQDFIDRACIAYMREEPRRKPTPGEVYQRAVAMIPRPKLVAPEPGERRKKCTRDEAQAILEDVGFKLNRFGGDE